MSFFAAVNLHPSYFQQLLPIQPERRTRESVEIERAIPIDLRRARSGYPLYEEKYKSNVRREAIRGIVQPTKLSDAFFGQKNMQDLQNMIRYQVWKMTKHVIEPQDTTDLLIIMRSIYLQYSNMTDSCNDSQIQKEVDRLNLFILRDAVPDIITNVEQHFGYLRDAGRIPAPIPQPISLSNKGTRELRSQMDILAPNGDPLSNGVRPTGPTVIEAFGVENYNAQPFSN